VSTRILLIEDNPGDAIIFREKLNESDLDYELVHTPRLAEGLSLVGDRTFDIILCDLSLPDASGLQAVVRVRESAPDVPLLVLTGLDDADAAAQAKHEGAVDYLVKWYLDGPSLARYIRYAAAQYRLQQRVAAGEPPPHTGAEGLPDFPPPEEASADEVPAQAALPTEAALPGPSGDGAPADDAWLALLEASPDGIAVVRTDRTVLFANPQARAWIGSGEEYPWPVTAGRRRVGSKRRPIEQHASPARWREEDAFVVTLRDEPPGEPSPAAEAGALGRAAEGALEFIEQVERRSRWMADVLRSALDLHQPRELGADGMEEMVDLAELAQRAGREHRALALARGLPLRVHAHRKKVMVFGDRFVIGQLLHRVLLDALQSAHGGEVELDVDVEGLASVIRATWEAPPGGNIAVPQALPELAREVVEGLTARLRGQVAFEREPGRERVEVRLPGREGAEV